MLQLWIESSHLPNTTSEKLPLKMEIGESLIPIGLHCKHPLHVLVVLADTHRLSTSIDFS